jgi:hypothetical protein
MVFIEYEKEDNMKLANEIIETITNNKILFENLTEKEWSAKPYNSKWSKKEILGHLIDSAVNNLRRFIVTLYQQNDKIVYHQDEWVNLQNYQGTDVGELIQLWIGLNRQLARVVSSIPADKLKLTCDTGKDEIILHTLEFLMDDYLRHLRHHLSQIEKC